MREENCSSTDLRDSGSHRTPRRRTSSARNVAWEFADRVRWSSLRCVHRGQALAHWASGHGPPPSRGGGGCGSGTREMSCLKVAATIPSATTTATSPWMRNRVERALRPARNRCHCGAMRRQGLVAKPLITALERHRRWLRGVGGSPNRWFRWCVPLLWFKRLCTLGRSGAGLCGVCGLGRTVALL